MLILYISKNHKYFKLQSMKQIINTIKQERKKLQTFSALGWVKSPQSLRKWGSTSSLTRNGKKAWARSNGWLGLGEEEGELIYSGRINTGWCLQPVLIHFYIFWSLLPPRAQASIWPRARVLLLLSDLEWRRCPIFSNFVVHSSKCTKGLQLLSLLFDGIYYLFHTL